MGKKAKKKKSKGKKSKKGKTKQNAADGKSTEAQDCRVLETKVTQLQSTKEQYRVAAQKLLRENETLEQQFEKSEKDTIQVVSYFKEEETRKDEQIAILQTAVKDMKRQFDTEKKHLVEDYTQQIYKLQEVLMEKTDEVKLMQAELKLVKEFRKKRAVMQKELDEIKDALYLSEKQQQENLSYMEKRFLEEKVRLQNEANFKIAELAQHAHSEAISNMEETTRNVYKENIRLNDTLGYHLHEGEELQKTKSVLLTKNKDLMEEKELNGLLVQEKVIENQELRSRLKQMDSKMEGLEGIVSQMTSSITNQNNQANNNWNANNSSNQEFAISKLQRLLDMKTKECSRIKFLAKRVLDERSEVEQFLLDSLQIVKHEIAGSRKQYRKDAEAAYTSRLLQAQRGDNDYPAIRTFNDLTTSTNDVHADMNSAGALQVGVLHGKELMDTTKNQEMYPRLTLADLSWEQREKVLRHLFSKINTSNAKQKVLEI